MSGRFQRSGAGVATRRRFLGGIALWSLAGAGVSGCLGRIDEGGTRTAGALARHEFEKPQMGLPFRLVLYTGNPEQARTVATAVFDRIAALNAVLSDYEEESELSRFSRTSGSGLEVELGEDLAAVLARGQEIARRTDGAFDMTVGPMVQLWRRARRQHVMPSADRVEGAKLAVGWRHLKLRRNIRGRWLGKLDRPGMRLDLGGIAKGYALDEAAQVMRARGIRHGLISGSGDMVAVGAPPGQRGWRVEVGRVEHPGAPNPVIVFLRDGALCTSGDAFQHVELGGVRYSHIVNPKTGLGLTDRSQVTLIGRDGMTTDALATAASVAGLDGFCKTVQRFPGVEGFAIAVRGERLETVQTRGWMKELGPRGR